MHVKMEDDLSSTPFNIEEQFISRFGNSLFLRRFPGPPDHFGKEPLILFRQIIEAPDMFLGNDEEMDRGMGMNVLKDDEGIILIDDPRRFVSLNDLTEEAALIHS